MKFIKHLAISLLMVAVIGVGACSSSGGGTPDQSDVDFAFQDFVFDLEDLAFFLDLFGAPDCSSIEADLASLEGTILCDISGESTIEVSNIVCDPGPPLTVSFDISQIENNCDDDFQFFNGTTNATVTFDGNEVRFDINSPGITVDDLTFSFAGFMVTIDNTNTATCSGQATVNGETCIAETDCSGCTLQ